MATADCRPHPIRPSAESAGVISTHRWATCPWGHRWRVSETGLSPGLAERRDNAERPYHPGCSPNGRLRMGQAPSGLDSEVKDSQTWATAHVVTSTAYGDRASLGSY